MTSQSQLNQRDGLLILAAGLLYGLFVWAIVPGWPVAMNDDFGYLRSIIETIQHGRPWTNDFLEPWSYSLVALSAGIFQLTGSFTYATVGLQVAMAATAFWLTCHIAHECGYRTSASIGLAFCLLTFPTVLWKQVEYTALVLYLPCLLAALWCAGKNRWNWFMVVWAVAVASRPSAVAWLALPVFAGLESAFTGRDWRKLRTPALLVVLGAGWFFLVRACANETHAQHYITSRIFTDVSFPAVWQNLKTGFWVWVVTAGCAALLFRALQRHPESWHPGMGIRPAAAAVAVCLLVTLPWVARAVPLSFEHTLFENFWAEGYLKGLVIVAALGWLIAPPAFNVPILGASLVALLLASLRSGLWDYYLIDAALLVFFAIRTSPADPSPVTGKPSWTRWLLPSLAGALTVVIIALHVNATGPLKRLVDQRAGACSVLEKAMRAGWMKPTELSDAPFGLVAWHLLPYYLAHEGKTSTDLGGFGIYVAKDCVNVRIEGVSSIEAKTAPPADPAHPFAEIHPRGWFGHARYTLERTDHSQPAAVAIPAEDYRYPLFPLNDAEWRELALARPAPR